MTHEQNRIETQSLILRSGLGFGLPYGAYRRGWQVYPSNRTRQGEAS
jgi:hypothetical protein